MLDDYTSPAEETGTQFHNFDSLMGLYDVLMLESTGKMKKSFLGSYSVTEEWLRKRILVLEETNSILELGCGNGHLALSFAAEKIADRILGVDISGEMIGLAVAAAQDFGLAVKFSRTAIENLEISETFDVIVCCETLEHLFNVRVVLDKIQKLLKPKGLFAGSVPYKRTCDNGSHLHYFDEQSLSLLLDDFFSVTEYERIDVSGLGEFHIVFACKHRTDYL